MWKDVLYYSKKEKRAVYVLIIIIAFLYFTSNMIPYLLRSKITENDIERYRSEYPEFFENSTQKETIDHKNKTIYSPATSDLLFKFDPNTADSIAFIQLGLKPYQIKNILKYRRKGGKFKTPEDFSRIYGLERSQFDRLEPFIVIPKNFKTIDERPQYKYNIERISDKRANFEKQEKFKPGTILDLNSTDTIRLKKIPGIGSGISKRITEYRNKLGGFYSVEQLKDIWGITPELYEDLKVWFNATPENISRIRVNDSTVDQIVQHPYISYKQAKILVELRKKNGPLHSMKQLTLLEEFSSKDIERLSYYLNFDD